MREPSSSHYGGRIMSDDDIPPRDEENPDERELSRRSGGPAVGIWLVLGLIFMLGAAVYVISAVL